ncbi:MAG: class I SAM-dependent methyltransferase [Peptococcaceae bacterium]|nr:MAG: class I SAM-dependent methyltransferase [Peptococcaceae bacterium]
MEKEKIEAIRQWTNDPCDAVFAGGCEKGSREFFEKVREYRYKRYAPWLKKLLDGLEVKGKEVLEIGCGMGNDLLTFAQNGANATGMDLVPAHIALAQKLFEFYGCRAAIMEMDAESLSFPDDSFDLVYSFGVLHHTPNIEKAILEIHRVLRPGGKAVIGLYHKNSWHYWVNLILFHGIIKRKLFSMPIDEMLSRSVEFSRSGARPLVRVYTRDDCEVLFRDFHQLKIKTYHWRASQIPVLGKCFPFVFLPHCWGWYIFSFAVKSLKKI